MEDGFEAKGTNKTQQEGGKQASLHSSILLMLDQQGDLCASDTCALTSSAGSFYRTNVEHRMEVRSGAALPADQKLNRRPESALRSFLTSRSEILHFCLFPPCLTQGRFRSVVSREDHLQMQTLKCRRSTAL